MEILLGVLASLAGVIVGGVLQHIASQRGIDRQHAWERSRLVHEKLELIAQVSTEVGGTLSNVYFNAIVAVESGERYKTRKIDNNASRKLHAEELYCVRFCVFRYE